MTRWAVVLAMVALSSFGWAHDRQTSSDNSKLDEELSSAAGIVQEMTSPNTTAGIPEDVLKNAKCIAVALGMINAGFVVGGRHGRGVATCRTSDNRWSPPAAFEISGASYGAQIGGEKVDLVMMIMNQNGMQALESGHFKIGAEVSGAAGPVGRQAEASGGWKAGILTYSRAKGAFAGITLNGAELRQDKDATAALYGQDVPFSQILNSQVPMPTVAQAQHFINAVQQAQQTAMAH